MVVAVEAVVVGVVEEVVVVGHVVGLLVEP